MTRKHELEPKDAIIEQIVSQLDLSGMTQEELFGYNGLVKCLTSRLLNRILETEMDEHLAIKNIQMTEITAAIIGTDILKRQFLRRIRKLN